MTTKLERVDIIENLVLLRSEADRKFPELILWVRRVCEGKGAPMTDTEKEKLMEFSDKAMSYNGILYILKAYLIWSQTGDSTMMGFCKGVFFHDEQPPHLSKTLEYICLPCLLWGRERVLIKEGKE